MSHPAPVLKSSLLYSSGIGKWTHTLPIEQAVSVQPRQTWTHCTAFYNLSKSTSKITFTVGLIYSMLGCVLQLVLLAGWDRTETVRRSEGSWLQHTESLVAAHTAARESWSTGSKPEQAWEEGDMPNHEQQRYSCLSADNFCWVWARYWTPSCVHYMSRALLKARGCRWGHQGHAWWGGSEVGELGASQRQDIDRVRPCEEYRRWYSDWGIQRIQRLLILGSTRDGDLKGVVWM